MTQGERVREIRKELGMTLEKFGEKLGVGKTAISKIEKGENSLTEQMTIAICREYNVNYDYLVNGDGEMFSDLPQTLLDDLCLKHGLDNDDKELVSMFLKMPSEMRDYLKSELRKIFQEPKEK